MLALVALQPKNQLEDQLILPIEKDNLLDSAAMKHMAAEPDQHTPVIKIHTNILQQDFQHTPAVVAVPGQWADQEAAQLILILVVLVEE
jgi:hypothetical protein